MTIYKYNVITYWGTDSPDLYYKTQDEYKLYAEILDGSTFLKNELFSHLGVEDIPTDSKIFIKKNLDQVKKTIEYLFTWGKGIQETYSIKDLIDLKIEVIDESKLDGTIDLICLD
jgi:hypothetical protein